MILDRACERSAPVAEQLAFEKLVGQRRAVLDDERLVPAKAVVVESAGDQLLAGSGLARDQDRDVVRRDPPHAGADFVHGARRVADDTVVALIGLAKPWRRPATTFSARLEDIFSSMARSSFSRWSLYRRTAFFSVSVRLSGCQGLVTY